MPMYLNGIKIAVNRMHSKKQKLLLEFNS